MRRTKIIAGITMFATCTALMLTSCSNPKSTQDNGGTTASGEAALPSPDAHRGSVTGMPDSPGPRATGPASATQDAIQPADPAVPNDAVVLPPADANASGDGLSPAPGATADDQQAPDEPTPQDAVAVVRDYYAAIAGHDYPHAWALWSDSGRASGQTPQQFADGFANTTQVTLQADAPGRVDAAAGSRFIEIPVAIAATQRDGSVRNYAGVYTMRRAMVDGATTDQRAWRIASARLHEVQP